MTKDFVAEFTGKKNTGNTPENKGQCVGLIMVYINRLGLSHIWGHAKDIYTNAPVKEWTKTKNTPKVYPKEGDVICWDKTKGGGYGHIALVSSSDPKADTVTVFEQNNPAGNPPKTTVYKDWSGIIGWLRPKVDEEPCKREVEELTNRVKILEENLEKKVDELVNKINEHNDLKKRYEELKRNSKQEIDVVLNSRSQAIEETSNLKTYINSLQSEYNTLSVKYERLLKEYNDILSERDTLRESSLSYLFNKLKEMLGVINKWKN